MCKSSGKGVRRAGCAVLLLMLLAGCAAPGGMQATATSTVQVVDGAGAAAVEYIEQQMYASLTQQAIQNETIKAGAVATATQQAVGATATQQAVQMTAQAWQVTVSAAQAHDTATAQAQATATQNYWNGVTATVQAGATATADWKTQQAPIIAAQATAIGAQAEQAQMEAEKARWTMVVSAWGPWVFLAALLAAAGFVIWQKSQVGVVPTDSNGRPQMVIINQGGQKVLVSPDLMAGPAMVVDGAGVGMPMLVDGAFQERTTHGKQIVDAVRALPPGMGQQGKSLMSGLASPQAGSVQINVVQPQQVQGWLDDVTGQVTEVNDE